MMKLIDDVGTLKGIGPKKQQALAKLGIKTLEDMLMFFPREYEDRRHIVPIAQAKYDIPTLVKGEVKLVVTDGYRYGKKQRLKLLVADDTGSVEAVFFNAAYLKNKFKNGDVLYLYGKISDSFGKKQMLHPEYFDDVSEEACGIIPVYPLTKGVSQKEMRSWQKKVNLLKDSVDEYLPEYIVRENRLCGLDYALENIHFPMEKQKLLEAKYRLIFDELLTLQTGIFAIRQNIKNGVNGIPFSKDVDINHYIDSLPYMLTGAQKRCVKEIESDLVSMKVMNRLVQGDVGSGKTAVAQIAMYKAAKSGYQSVLMAPTEILARQHFEGIRESFREHGINTALLVGSMNAADKRKTLAEIKSGEVDIIVGTHALIQPDVEYFKLGLAITDEQHRFGVNQRMKLKSKGDNPNVLVMTATPIPRTLSVVLYGDMDVSIIDELPPGRQAIETKNWREHQRGACYDFVEKQLKLGRQAYVVTPLIEDSETVDARSVTTVFDELRTRFKGYNVDVLHGTMSSEEKDEKMKLFSNGKIDVLVATVVIEVGINVPNATVMIIENAERFGLAQLHQLRGRVGRGVHQSYCFLITSKESEIAIKRADIMEKSTDGFYIAEEDLKLRGPGEIFGTRQHGVPDLVISDLAKHYKVLSAVKDVALKILNKDPELSMEENQGLRKRIRNFFGDDFTLNL